jgi:hypothetical protein
LYDAHSALLSMLPDVVLFTSLPGYDLPYNVTNPFLYSATNSWRLSATVSLTQRPNCQNAKRHDNTLAMGQDSAPSPLDAVSLLPLGASTQKPWIFLLNKSQVCKHAMNTFCRDLLNSLRNISMPFTIHHLEARKMFPS